MTFRDLIGVIPNPQRVLVMTEDKTELYRGYVGCYGLENIEHDEINKMEVAKVTLHTETFKRRERIKHILSKRERISTPDGVTDWAFSDLEFMIYTKIIVKK